MAKALSEFRSSFLTFPPGSLKRQSGPQIRNNQRVGTLGPGRNLGHKKRGNIERVIRKFDNSGLSIKIDPCDLEMSVIESIPKLWIETIVAVEWLPDFWLLISLMGL